MNCQRCGSENVLWKVVEEEKGKDYVWFSCEECDWEDIKYVF